MPTAAAELPAWCSTSEGEEDGKVGVTCHIATLKQQRSEPLCRAGAKKNLRK